jgi:hypothetical protein
MFCKTNNKYKHQISKRDAASYPHISLFCVIYLFWRVVHVATGLTPPKSIAHMLRNWLTDISKKERSLIFVGAAVLMCTIWCTRNDLIFEKNNLPHLFI